MLMLCLAAGASAQDAASEDTRTQYPAFMRDSYFTLRMGYIGYLFTATQLEPGFQAESIERPRPAVRLDFFGHRFTKNLSAQVTYMRPGQFVEYNNVNGKNGNHPVSNAYAGLTFVLDVPLNEKLSAYVEGGYGVTSRSGIVIDGKTARNGALRLGAGRRRLTYQMTKTVDFMLGATYSPGRQAFEQPSTRMHRGAALQHAGAARVDRRRQTG
jgi:opacity protein-like surface antigen